MSGHLNATFPYILSHLQYIVGEILRNSIQALVESQDGSAQSLPPIEVSICESPQHVIIRISDQGGGVPPELMPMLWSFSKGPQKNEVSLQNLTQVPKMAATMQELKLPESSDLGQKGQGHDGSLSDASLSSLSARPPNLRLGMGLPMSRIYAQ